VRKGHTHGVTDDYCYNTVEGGVHVNELNATILHLLGIDHEKLTFPHLGLQARLTGVEAVKPVREIMA
jgi:hypothetical protein